MKETSLDWRKGYPENSELYPISTFGSEYYRVLVTGRYQDDGHLYVDIVNRMRRKKTGYAEIDESDCLGVPLDDQWHWQSGMVEITAWSPLPKEDDPNWTLCSETLPEEVEEIHFDGRMKMLSVMALCEIFEGYPDVKLINRLSVDSVGNPYLDQQATDGWVWSNNAKKWNIKAWMPFPKPAEI